MSILEHDPSAPPEKYVPACRCGYPDLPGFCPGPSNCPMCESDDEQVGLPEDTEC